MAEYVKQGSAEHKALMKEWYGPKGKLAKSGFEDIEMFDTEGEPFNDLRGDPAKPNAVDLAAQTEFHEVSGITGTYELYYRFRERARDLEATKDYGDEWMLCLLVGEGWSHTDIARALDLSSTTVDRRVKRLTEKLIEG
jgi:hypothetical protein